MSPKGLLAVERARIRQRRNRTLCPGGNGTTIGTFQPFTVLCNTDLGGDVLGTMDASDLTACVDQCSSFHPKCEAASFGIPTCTLMANLKPQQRWPLKRIPLRRIESAVGAFPNASSNCATLGGAQQALGTNFTTMCGSIIDGNDISQNFAATFQDCLGECASTSGCAALSFNPSQDLGYKNCYLKTTVTNSSAVATDRRMDSAVVVNAAQIPESSTPSAAPPPTSSSIGFAFFTPPSGRSSKGFVFFTPPGGNTATAPAPAPPAISISAPTPSLAAPAPTNGLITSSSTPLAAQPPPLFFPSAGAGPSSTGGAAPMTPGGGAAGETPPSNAGVVAPVVGAVAAVALIAVSFTILRRWRSGKQGGRDGDGSGGGSGRRMTGIEDFSEANSAQEESVGVRESVRSSVAGSLTGWPLRTEKRVAGSLTGWPLSTEKLEEVEEGDARSGATGGAGGEEEETRAHEVKKGEAELRTSQNGLGQNKWS